MPKNLYEDPGRTPKPSERWVVKHEKAQPIAVTPPPEMVYEGPKREGTLNKHAQDLLKKSREYGN